MKNSIRKIRAISLKETIHVLRDIRSLILSIVVPVFLLVIFGYAIRMDIKNIGIGFVSYEENYISREMKDKLKATGVFSKIKDEYSLDEKKFLKNEIKAKVFIPSDFKKDFIKRRGSELVFIIDGSDPTLFSSLSGYMKRMIGEERNIFDFKYKILFNPEMKSEIFIVPGIIALILVVISAILVTLSISKEFETGTFYTLFTLPLKPYEIIIGKVIPYVFIGLIQFTLVLVFGKLLFGIPIRGNIFFLYFCAFIYILSGLGIGITVATKFKQTQTSLQVTWLVTILPSFLLSGFIFPIENIPLLLRVLTYVVPARYFLEILRGSLLRGSSFYYLIDDLFFLTSLSFLSIFIASRFIEREM
mgnify:CR=1 FL=1